MCSPGSKFDAESRFFRDEAMFLYDYHTLEIIDLNHRASLKYGLAREEAAGIRLTDLGEKFSHERGDDTGPTTIWWHKNSEGCEFYLQFTHHPMKLGGRTV